MLVYLLENVFTDEKIKKNKKEDETYYPTEKTIVYKY